MAWHSYARRRVNREERFEYRGLHLRVPPPVFHPGLYFTSVFLADYLGSLDLQGQRVLDMGSGSGILALVAARQGASVVALEVVPAAARVVAENARRNHLDESVETVCGDLLSCLAAGARFNLVMFNPPYLPGNPRNDFEKAFKGGERLQTLKQFIGRVGEQLVEGGRVLTVLSSEIDIEFVFAEFSRHGLTARTILQRTQWFETLVIVESRRALV